MRLSLIHGLGLVALGDADVYLCAYGGNTVRGLKEEVFFSKWHRRNLCKFFTGAGLIALANPWLFLGARQSHPRLPKTVLIMRWNGS